MKIIYDHQIFSLQNYGGISRYYAGLINGLRDRQVDCELLLKYSNNNFVQAKRYPNFNILGTYPGFLPKYLINRLNRINSINILKDRNNYIFHPTYYDDYFKKYLGSNPYVITIYDMVHELFPEQVHTPYPITKMKKSLVNGARAIISISQSTKKDIVRILHVPQEKIRVIHLCQNLDKGCLSLSNIPNLPEKYILFVGNRDGYKNFTLFIRAFNIFSQRFPDYSLVCAGSLGFDLSETALINRTGLRERIFHFPINNDQQLAVLYKNAQFFVYPSLYEGFGIPVLEAFESGTPVLCSNTSSFPEVAGEAAIYFNPGSAISIFQAMQRVQGNKFLRDKVVRMGKARLKLFSRDKMINQTESLYEEISND